MGTLKPQSNGPLYSNTVTGTLAVDGWAVTFIYLTFFNLPRPAATATAATAATATA